MLCFIDVKGFLFTMATVLLLGMSTSVMSGREVYVAGVDG